LECRIDDNLVADMIKVLFAGKDHRVRRRETMMNPPQGVEFVPQYSLEKMKKDYQLSGMPGARENRSLAQVINAFFTYNNFIPKRFLKGIGMIYSPGKIIFNRFPWVVEVDNVAVLTYYYATLLYLFKPLIRYKLRSRNCRRIICISEAAKKSVINFFRDKVIEDKCVVVYPFVNTQYLTTGRHENRSDSHRNIRLLYVSTQFYLKGGKELVHVFDRLSKRFSNIELCVVSNTPQEVIKSFRKNSRISFIPAKLEKKELYEQYYAKSDIFVQISYQDSFGLVYLEAISAGLPVIATDVFAIPEIIEDGKNGFILKSPLRYFNDDCTPNYWMWNRNLDKIASKVDYTQLERELEKKLVELIEKPELRRKFSEHSRYLVSGGKFNESARKQALRQALK
jgi:glycosyltransferase involved in cell wall biosynthesis